MAAPMISTRERRRADRFFADLMGVSRPPRWRTEAGAAAFDGPEAEDAQPGWRDLKTGRVVFYDEDTLEYIEGWTRANGQDAVCLINRGAYDPIRADARQRSREFDRYLAYMLANAGRRAQGTWMSEVPAPLFIFDPALHTAPLNRRSPGDWDDLMISRLAGAGRPLFIQLEGDQWVAIRKLFDQALQSAQQAAPRTPAREFVAYFVLDSVRATLTLVPAANVTMQGHHAVIPVGRIRGTRKVVLPNGDAGQRVIGDIHTHVLLDPLIDLSSTSVGTTVRSTTTRLYNGVSDVDRASAKDDRLVVYAIDSKSLHRANPDGTHEDGLNRSGNVLREALRIFGGEPR